MSPSVLNLILQALDANGEAVFGPEDVAGWPKGDFEEALRTGLLEEAAPANEVVCPGCEEACHEDVEIIHGAKPENTRAYVICGQRDDIGRVAIPLESLDRWAVNRQKAEGLRPPPKRTGQTKGKTKKPKASAAHNRILLIQALLQHHRVESDEPNWEPASQEDLAAAMCSTQPTVSRTMGAIFGNAPMATYHRACKQQRIIGFLEKLEDGTARVDAEDPHSDIQ